MTFISRPCGTAFIQQFIGRLSVLGCILFLCAIAYPLQQTPPKEMEATVRAYWPRAQSTFRADSNLVEVAVVIRDSHGKAIGNLAQSDFEIEDNGKKQELASFSLETVASTLTAVPAIEVNTKNENKPSKIPASYVALLFDDLNMPLTEQVQIKAAATRFLKQGVGSNNLVGLFTTSGKQIVPFTRDAEKISAAVADFKSSPLDPGSGLCPKMKAYDAYVIASKTDYETFVTKRYEMVQCLRNLGSLPSENRMAGSFANVPMNDPLLLLASGIWEQFRALSGRELESMTRLVDFMGGLPGRKVILLASSGFLTRTLDLQQQELIDHSLHSNVVINAIDSKGLYTDDLHLELPNIDPGTLQRLMRLSAKQNDNSKDVLAMLTRSTGGLFFENNNDFAFGFRQLGMIPEASYLLTFLPQEPPNGKYHSLKVRLKSKSNYIVQARTGYWATKKKQQARVSSERRIDASSAKSVGPFRLW